MPEPKRPVLIGGPLDGATIAPGARPAFIYCAEGGVRNGETRAIAFSAPGKTTVRHLYRFDSYAREGGDAYVFAGDAMRRCNGCGGYVRRSRARCVFCGVVAKRAVPQ
ncbi:MAG: hypothetical protein ABW167_09555 [Baekduia sp.]